MKEENSSRVSTWVPLMSPLWTRCSPDTRKKSEMTMSQWFISMECTSSRVASGEIQSSLSTNCM